MNEIVKHKGTGGWLPWRGRSARHVLARRAAGAAALAAGAVLLLPSAAVAVPAATAAPGAGSGLRTVLDDQFLAVSCPARHVCVAVGIAALNNQQVLAERWNGSRWSVMNLPVPAGATSGGLTGVSCTSASACTAVGFYGSPSGSGPLAERWNGQSWAIQPTPSPGNAGVPFAGVSCASATSCTAVGYYDFGDVGFTSNTLVEHWDGTSWAIQSTPQVGDPGSDLTSVSCPSAALCMAAGYQMTQNDEGQGSAPLSMLWQGTSWTVAGAPGGGDNEDTGLSAISCPAVNACTAVGEDISATALVERWNGTRWRVQAPSGQSTTPPLAGVSCSSPSACTAVGGTIAPPQGFVERWNGHTWSLQHLSMPAGATALTTAAVSCPAASACTAVGVFATKHAELTLAERWNGHSWAVQATQNPTPS